MATASKHVINEAFRTYNPVYDPLIDTNPGQGQQYAPTYWIGTAGTPPRDDGPVTADMDADVVIIGSGFTGLSCAIFLARGHGIKATVLEANRSSWGCSTRNGGQAQCASGRLKRSQWIERWGRDVAIDLHKEVCDAMEHFKGLIAEVDCEPQPGGHLYIAHKPGVMPGLRKETEICNQVLTDTRVLRHYYRLLPDGRVQIGSRSAISGRDAPHARYEALLRASLARKFPALAGLDIEYSWWGWVDVSHDMMPRICQPDPQQRIFYALGYGGNGVMYSAQAGRRMAERIAGRPPHAQLPIFTSQLPYPNVLSPAIESQLFAPFRRFGQRFLYRWYYMKDERR